VRFQRGIGGFDWRNPKGRWRTSFPRSRHADREARRVILKAPPAELGLPADGARITVIQRHTKAIQDTNGYLRLHLGDITAGQVLVTLSTRDETTLVDQESMAEGEVIAFDVGGNRYMLKLVQLTNLLIGDDYAVFQVKPSGKIDRKQEKRRIEALIGLVEGSSVTFIRNGKSVEAPEMADHLRKKFEFVEPQIRTLRQFIERVASFSWGTGNVYRVRLRDGTAKSARKWLKGKIAELPTPSQDN